MAQCAPHLYPWLQLDIITILYTPLSKNKKNGKPKSIMIVHTVLIGQTLPYGLFGMGILIRWSLKERVAGAKKIDVERIHLQRHLVLIIVDLYLLQKYIRDDLSNNAFEGEIPECIGELISIHGLNLSHNRLTGGIPESISMLSHLESLDISSNLLSGHIPQELVALTFLEVFNVSDNKLEGLIPEGNNFNTYLADSYQGNLGLCGTPLPECGGSHEPSPNNTESNEDGESVLSMWKIIVMGFTSGVVVGFAWGYYMLSVGKPFWFIKLANTIECALIDFREEHFGRRRRKQRIARE